MDHHVKDPTLADAGKARIEWADADMPRPCRDPSSSFEAEKSAPTACA